MAPSHGDAAQTPEPKSSSGFASVFKSLTGGKSTKHNANATAAEQKIHALATSKSHDNDKPIDFEHFCRQLSPGNTLRDRVDAAEALKFLVQDQPLEGVTTIFNSCKDLIEPSKPDDARKVGYALLIACVKNDGASEPERSAYFNTITGPAHPADFDHQLNCLAELARHGKDLSGFHYQILPLLSDWLKKLFEETGKHRKHVSQQQRNAPSKAPVGEETSLKFLFAFVVDVIKFGFNISSTESTSSLLDVVLFICVNTPDPTDLKACVGVIDTIVTYGEMPADYLEDCIKVLCSIHCLVNDVHKEAWRSIRTFCQSHHGQRTVQILLAILQHPRSDPVESKQTIREIRGAISVLSKIFGQNAKDRFPPVSFTLLVQALMQVVNIRHSKIENDVMQLILSILANEEKEAQQIQNNIMEEDWTDLFAVITRCSKRLLESSGPQLAAGFSRISSPLGRGTPEQTLTSNVELTLRNIIEQVENLVQRDDLTDFFQREDCVNFMLEVHQYLPASAANVVIDFFIENRSCYPSDLNYVKNITALATAFLADRNHTTQVRLHALQAITDTYPVLTAIAESELSRFIDSFFRIVLEDVDEEKDILVLQELVSFAVQIAEFAEDDLFEWIVASMKSTFRNDQIVPSAAKQHGESPANSTAHSQQSPSFVVTRGLVHIFMKTMDRQSSKSLRIFKELLAIAKLKTCQVDARIQALKMLFRLRADWGGRVFLTSFTESDGLAASLYRTQASLERKQATDDAADKRHIARTGDSASPRISRSTSFSQGNPSRVQPFRSVSGVNKILTQENSQAWMSPDPEALPEPASGVASHTLFSFSASTTPQSRNHVAIDSTIPKKVEDEVSSINQDDENVVVDKGSGNKVDADDPSGVRIAAKKSDAILDIPVYLDTIINLMQYGCDWEVYSYILVHLPSQLTNQALFKTSIPQIRSLRSLLCDQVKNNSFQVPHKSSGLWKADVNICLFQVLNMVMSYHSHFSKPEDDEIVQTFVKGVGERTSKSCIHALSICCHELPNSTSRNLISLLQKMSQIVTQSHVAVHILEFLACLARMPHVYTSFREEEHRIVFAICFRYLDYAREQSQKDTSHGSNQVSERASLASSDSLRGMAYVGESNFQPNASDDLPQYVYALAYHVIIFWFLSLKLEDRASQVSWITKSLVSTDINGKESIDEQAQVTLDFIQRVAYADVEESKPDPDFTSERFGKINKNRWVVGNAIVTIEQLHSGDWGQITKRQPSGTSCYIIREKYNRPYAHQIPSSVDASRLGETPELVLPSHLLVQIVASIPQASSETFRPIPLPMDDMTERAVKALDKIFTVDSYKAGVIYIGENQTEEAEILANESGSSDYTEFLHGLGTVVPLKGANFNPHGLDRVNDADGEFVICWRDRVTEIVFHATTEMPTNRDNDPHCINKKRHIGNDFVNIIFNNSGLPFKFDTFPSDFNYVNIVIAPESRETFLAARNRDKDEKEHAFYKVQVMSKPGFPEISPAAETKIIGLSALPGFIRLLALNASVFSLVWCNRHGDNHVSSWRARLREINRIRDRHSSTSSSSNFSNPTSPSGIANSATHQESNSNKVRESLNSLRRSSVANFLTSANAKEDMASHRSSMISTAETEVGSGGAEGSLVDTLDFSRWAGPGKIK